MPVKIFSNNNTEKLEEMVNEFLKEHKKSNKQPLFHYSTSSYGYNKGSNDRIGHTYSVLMSWEST